MGLILCDICNKQLSFNLEVKHVCNPEDIKIYIEHLENRARTAENRLSDIANNVLHAISELSKLKDGELVENTLEGEEVTVKTKWLKKLWEAANCRRYESDAATSFLSRWIAAHRILCEAFDLFRSKKHGSTESKIEKLRQLKKVCENAQQVFGYEDSNLDLNPEDLV